MFSCCGHLRAIFWSIVISILLKCIDSQEMLENPRCNHYPDRGTCEDRGFTTKWYYDRYSHRCREFYYSGCEGNDNRFDSFEECSQTCRYESPEDPRRRCALPHDPGTCAGNFERWHFDLRIRQCVCSWWSGCGGNANLFYSYDHCMSICGIFADSRTTATRFAARRSIHSLQNHQLTLVKALEEGRRYQNLFASSHKNDSQNYLQSHSGEDTQSSHIQSGQQQGAQPGGRNQDHVNHNSTQQNNTVPMRNRKHYAQNPMVRKRERIMQKPSGKWTPQALSERTNARPVQNSWIQSNYSAHRNHKQVELSSEPRHVVNPVKDRPQAGQVPTFDEATYAREIAAAQTDEYLRSRQRAEAYAQQQQAYERARAEALRERERLLDEQRRQEYERALKYQQELQRYQQAVYAAQNRIPKERMDESNNWPQQLQQSDLQEQSRILKHEESTPSVLTPTDSQKYDEIKRAKAKLRKRLKFEKFKQMEKIRRLFKTTPQPVTTVPIPPLQPHWWSSGYESGIQQHQPQRYQSHPDSYQAALYDRTYQLMATSTNGTQITATARPVNLITQPNKRPATEMLDVRRNHVNTVPELGQRISNRSVDGNREWPITDSLSYKIVVAADQVSDIIHDGIRHEETISARLTPTESLGKGKHVVTIGEYDEEEQFTDDEGYQTEDEV